MHDLVNAPAGGSTLFAATANGVYLFEGTLPWVQYPQTAGFRVLKFATDPARGVVYLIAQPSNEPFAADISPPIHPGTLYRMDIASGTLSAMMATEVSGVTVCGDGVVLAAGNARGTAGTGTLYRFPLANSNAHTAFRPFSPYWAISDIQGAAGSTTLFALRNSTNLADALISDNNTACGTSWGRSRIAGVTNAYFTKSTHLNGGALTVLGRDASGHPLLGSSAGSVYAWAGTNWQSLGTISPAYPVAGFGSDASGSAIAVLRKYNWEAGSGDDPNGGFFSWNGSSWARDGRFDAVTDFVSEILPYFNGTAWETWAAFDDAGIWRIPAGGSAPGEQADEGITAVSLSGIVLDPRQADRALAFGAGGLHERRDGVWRRLVLGTITNSTGNPVDQDTAMLTRERGFLSAALSTDDPGVIWAGGNTTGLFRGQRVSPDSWEYVFKLVYWDTLGGGIITDVIVDAFDPGTLWIATRGRGALRSDNEGATWTAISDPLSVLDLENDLLEPPYRSFLAGIQPTGNGTGLLCGDGEGVLDYTSLFMVSWVESLAFNPIDLGHNRALAGPTYLWGGQGMAILKTDTGPWQYDPDTLGTQGLPSSAHFGALVMPVGYDGDEATDAFTTVYTEGTNPQFGLFYSVAETAMGSPGREWHDMDPEGELDPYVPSSVTVHPRDGNLLWVATSAGSAFTLMGAHVTDNVPPAFPLAYGLTVVAARPGDGIDLSWLAPGDDGDMPGWAEQYRLFYRIDRPIAGPDDLAGAFSVSLPRPQIAHRVETYTLDIGAHVGNNYFSIALKAFDEQGNSSVLSTAAVNFSPGNQAPVAVDDSQTTAEDYPVTIAVLNNDYDLNGDALSIISATAPAHGSIVVNGDNTINYTPNSDFFGTDSFTYTISDGNGGSDTAAVRLTVISDNHPPLVTGEDLSAFIDIPAIFSLLGNDSDAEGDTLSLAVVGTPGRGEAVILEEDAGTILYTPLSGYAGTDSFDYTVSDSHGATGQGRVSVTVIPYQGIPIATDDPVSTLEDVPRTIWALLNDQDADTSSLVIMDPTSDPSHGLAEVATDGKTVTYTPGADYFGTDTFSYMVMNDLGGTCSALVSISVIAVNDPPLLNTIGDRTLAEGDPLVIGVNAWDVDDTALAFSVIGLPVGASFSGTVFSWTPRSDQAGSYAVVFSVSDGSLADTERVVITVTDASGGGGGGGGGCFIATAAFGSPMAPEVDLLRAYRDGYLVHRAWGRALLAAYHRVSPPAARIISTRPMLRAVARMALRPILFCVGQDSRPNALPAATGLFLILSPLAVSGCVLLTLRKRRTRRVSEDAGKTPTQMVN